jgi:D-3-phosphoglycerate dehydrogenase
MARATAEMGATLLLYCARNVDFYREQLRSRSNRIYQDLHLHGSDESVVGREVAMIGFGRIGRSLVDLLRGFDLRWLVYDPYVPKSIVRKYPVRLVGLNSLLPRAHLLVLTAALTDETRGLLDRSRLARLPDYSAIVNIARGGLIDLDALTREVQRKRLRCALDVTDPLEPLPVSHTLRKLTDAILTPHVAAANRQVRHEIADVVIDDLERFFRHRAVRNRVTTEMLDRMT